MDFTNATKALTARGFKVSSFETAKEAAEYLNSQIDGATVGFGGSITLEELGLYALLSGHNTVFSHWHLPEGGQRALSALGQRHRRDGRDHQHRRRGQPCGFGDLRPQKGLDHRGQK